MVQATASALRLQTSRSSASKAPATAPAPAPAARRMVVSVQLRPGSVMRAIQPARLVQLILGALWPQTKRSSASRVHAAAPVLAAHTNICRCAVYSSCSQKGLGVQAISQCGGVQTHQKHHVEYSRALATAAAAKMIQ